MKILHTSDWNLGKKFFGRDRFSEKKAVLAEIVKIAGEKKPDIVLIAGNTLGVLDAPPKCVELLCETLTRLAAGGRRAVLLVSGGGDSAERLRAIARLADKQGISVITDPNAAPVKTNPSFPTKITASGAGYAEITCESGERVSVSVVPYIGAAGYLSLKGDDLESKTAGVLAGNGSTAPVKIVLIHAARSDISAEKESGKLSERIFDGFMYVALGGADAGSGGKFFASGGITDYDFSEKGRSVILAELTEEGLRSAEYVPLRAARRSKVITVSGFGEAGKALNGYKNCYTRLIISSDKSADAAGAERLYGEFPLLADVVFNCVKAAEYAPPVFIDPSDKSVFADFLAKTGADGSLSEIFGEIMEDNK
ncbi:MAG: hypothetical protein LBP79_07030 [Clostridiales bacterium]|jgi:exonuclease SbcD|nr:hypothetical protein [Clostridiales bacterium]